MRRLIQRIHNWGKYHCQWWLFTRRDMQVSVTSARRNATLLAHRDIYRVIQDEATRLQGAAHAELAIQRRQEEEARYGA